MSSSNIVESMGTENSQKPMPRIMGLAICLPCIAIFLILVGALCYSIIRIRSTGKLFGHFLTPVWGKGKSCPQAGIRKQSQLSL
ncbi:MAG: hypothetical protein UV15_C0013G0017 [Candidatus Uhrbacteria bacterium GW2011_GWA2_42_220]|nr:MAG: hypothetical protein UV15_C0013G0017 [Candidatus Uhrbacteria bacterium GW2011_GWA2_42_220]